MLFSSHFYKELVLNAVFWTGLLAVGITLYNRDFSLGIFLAAVIAFNLILALALRALAPKAFEQAFAAGAEEAGGDVGFRITPVRYPKVLDEELRDFAPEFIRFDISKNGALVFSANMARDAMRQLRDALQGALEVKEVVARQITPQAQTAKKTKKKN